MEVSIICVNWNSLDYLKDCIASIYVQTHRVSFEIIVVDNASTEGRAEELRELFPGTRVIKSKSNLGFAGANNLASRDASGEYILFLNPDTKLLGPAIDIMMQCAGELTEVGIIGCRLLNSDLTISTTTVQKFPTIINQLLNIEWLRLSWPGCPLWDLSPLFGDQTNPVQVEVIPGACMLIKREVFIRAGLFNEAYFMYGEDLDLNYQVKRLGLCNYYIGAAEVIHFGGKSSSKQPVSQWATMLKHRAMLLLFTKTRGRIYGQAYRGAMVTAASLRLCAIAMALPFIDRDVARIASKKWSAVLKWALGRSTLIQ